MAPILIYFQVLHRDPWLEDVVDSDLRKSVLFLDTHKVKSIIEYTQTHVDSNYIGLECAL